MTFTFYELVWFYFIYSLTGWCAEVCVAAARKKKFINRGFVSGPLCPIYGTGAVVFAVFLPELRENPFFLFLGGVILGIIRESDLILMDIFVCRIPFCGAALRFCLPI